MLEPAQGLSIDDLPAYFRIVHIMFNASLIVTFFFVGMRFEAASLPVASCYEPLCCCQTYFNFCWQDKHTSTCSLPVMVNRSRIYRIEGGPVKAQCARIAVIGYHGWISSRAGQSLQYEIFCSMWASKLITLGVYDWCWNT